MVPPSPQRTRTDLLLFFAGTFAVSWLPWGLALLAGGDIGEPLPQLLFVVGAFGPTAVALLLWCGGRRRPRGPNPFRAAGRWLLPALLLGAAPAIAAALVDGTLDLATAGDRAATIGGPLMVIGFVLIAGPLSEEFGWRGYAQPRLRRTLSPVWTAVLLGLVWAAWHVPLFLLPGTTQAEIGLGSWETGLFFAAFLPMSYTICVMSERLRGGVAAAVVVHFAGNGAAGLFPTTSTVGALLDVAVATAIAIALHLLVGRTAPTAAVADRDATGRTGVPGGV
ncbi:CPBP family intramembrane metalloprotease [Pseudonocardia sp. DSM 110487]|uniref:CPBP family intramembrane glutamic endopeptidase n=1 Tax=Pseudonocardia sp. DSM 110487 TaxID=2865833 RepID=UPI001C6985B7|nr:type II CAAX endopeptidase family protein [Pseudonocardia sp. DSM 110487]QYN35357.1 CPBP family intramembrane metalloprotease [Pseudonocardia sp. DSM 110487]